MNKLFFFILFAYIHTFALMCQDNSHVQVLHFVTSNSEDHQSLNYLTDLYNYEEKPAKCKYNIVWILENGKLKVVDTISAITKDCNQITEFIHETKEKYFITSEFDLYDELNANGRDTSNQYLLIYDYSEKQNMLRNIKLSQKNGISFNLNQTFRNDGKILQTIGSAETAYQYYVINQKGNISKYTRKKDTTEVYVDVEPGAFMRDYQKYRFPGGRGGKLMTGTSEDFSTWVESPFQVPTQINDTMTFQGFTISHYYPGCRYLIGRRDYKDPSQFEYSMYSYYDYQNKNWDTFRLHSMYRTFHVSPEQYMYGTGVDWTKSKIKKARLLDEYLVAKKREYADSIGYIRNTHVMKGTFFVYHIPSKKFMEYISEENDIEVLLMIRDKVYFRVDDEIREILIDQKKATFVKKSEKVIVKDRYVVPHIHHLYFDEPSKAIRVDIKQE
jgi:hypothetical protein